MNKKKYLVNVSMNAEYWVEIKASSANEAFVEVRSKLNNEELNLDLLEPSVSEFSLSGIVEPKI